MPSFGEVWSLTGSRKFGVPCPQQDLVATLSIVTSAQDLVSGLAFSLLGLVKFTLIINLEFNMETNLFTVFEAVKSECASLYGG